MEQLHLPFLERLMVKNAASQQAELVLEIVAANRQFSSLISLSLELGHGENFRFENTHRWSNKTLRHLAIDGCRVPNFPSLLQAFPNLFQLEFKMVESPVLPSDSFVAYSLLRCIRVTLNHVVPDLDYLLRWTPNVKRLRLRGALTSENTVEQFERMP